MGAFGEKLRKQRELRGIELDAISNTTKISTRLLRALEDERFDQLPGGVFNKGFVRAYARQVGLDEEEAVAGYLAAVRESQLEQRPNSDVADSRAPAAKRTPVAAPEPRDNARRDDALPTPDLPANKPANNEGGNDRNNEVRTEDRRKQGRDRRNEDRRIKARRAEALRNETRRDEDRPDKDHPDEARLNEARHNEARLPPSQNKDIPALPDSVPRAPAANPRADRFRQKYPAGDPASADESSVPIPWGKLALALLLVTLFLAFWNFRRSAQPTAASRNASSSHPSPAPVSAPASAPTQPATSTGAPTAPPATHALTPSAGTASPPTITAATPARMNPAPPTLPAPAAPAPAASSLSPITSGTGSAAKPAAHMPQSDAKPPTPHTTARAATAKPPSSFTLQIRADETTWITLIADGKPVIANETLIAPAQTSVRATREIVVKTGNAAGISFLLNGKTIPPQGNEGEIGTYVFDATGLQTSPQTQPPTN